MDVKKLETGAEAQRALAERLKEKLTQAKGSETERAVRKSLKRAQRKRRRLATAAERLKAGGKKKATEES